MNTPYLTVLFWKHAALLAAGRRGDGQVFDEIRRLHWSYFQDDRSEDEQKKDMTKIAEMVGVA